jgi:hypothetical protein
MGRALFREHAPQRQTWLTWATLAQCTKNRQLLLKGKLPKSGAGRRAGKRKLNQTPKTKPNKGTGVYRLSVVSLFGIAELCAW